VVGFSLADLKRVLTMRDRGGAPCQGVRELVGQRLEALDRRIEEMRALREELSHLIADWDTRLAKAAPGERAQLLETLGNRALIERTRRKRQSLRP
jgi:hypothetical protein